MKELDPDALWYTCEDFGFTGCCESCQEDEMTGHTDPMRINGKNAWICCRHYDDAKKEGVTW